MLNFAKRIYPIHRSITGKGVLKTLQEIRKEIPKLKICSLNSGLKVFDWKIPPEWNISDAYIANLDGKKIIDFKENNLRIVNYSSPIDKILTKTELLKHIHTIPNRKNSIPYITSYYKKYWGFCLKHTELKLLHEKKYKVVISSKFNNKGKLHYGEFLIKGRSKKEILIHTYICHPQLANNEISGPTITTYLAKYFSKKLNNFSLRFIFVPETIGAISYLKLNLNKLKDKVLGGYVITCVGDNRNYSFLETKDQNSLSNKIAKKMFKKLKIKYKKYSYLKRGSDERQYNSPGINIPIASIMRTKYGMYPEYHNSDDNFNVVTQKGLIGSFNFIKKVIEKFDDTVIPIAVHKCEPFLSKRNLYPTISTGKISKLNQGLLDFLSYCDGTNDLDDIEKKIKLDKAIVKQIFKILKKK